MMNAAWIAHIKLSIGVVLVVLSVIFTVQNVAAAPVRLLFWKLECSLSLLIFGVLIACFIAGWLGASWLHFSRNRKKVAAAKAAAA